MSKYIQFDLSDGECQHFPVVVRIAQNISNDIKNEIEQTLKYKIDEYLNKDEYWKNDDILIKDVMKLFSVKYRLDFEIVNIDYWIGYEN